MKKIIIAAFIISLLSVLVISSVNDKTRRPNVVIIIADTLRAEELGCYGYKEDISPEIDELAALGVQFTDVTAQSSWTRPSLGSMITSLYPRTIGLYKESFDILADDHLTMAEILKSNGYSTFGITANPNINSYFNFDQGFDSYIDTDVIWDWMNEEEGKDVVSDVIKLPDSRMVFQKALDYAKRDLPEPSFIFINIMEIHEKWRLLRPEFKEGINEKNREIKGYHAAVRQVSHDIKQFIDELRRLPDWENTLFIITSDHGEGLNSHPDVSLSDFHGYLLYKSHIKVPMIWYYPSFNPSGIAHFFKSQKPKYYSKLTPEVNRTRIRLMDLLPSLLDFLGIEYPDNFAGRSFVPAMYGGKETEIPEYFISETYFRGMNKIGVFSNEWELILNRDKHLGVNTFELQAADGVENGKVTDKIFIEKDVASFMNAFMQSWIERFPQVPPLQPEAEPSEEVVDQLKSLGYLD